MDFTWPMAITIIGSVATVCLTIWRIMGSNRTKPIDHSKEIKAITVDLTQTKLNLAVLDAKYEDHKEDDKEEFEKVRDQIRDLTNIVHELLKKLAG